MKITNVKDGPIKILSEQENGSIETIATFDPDNSQICTKGHGVSYETHLAEIKRVLETLDVKAFMAATSCRDEETALIAVHKARCVSNG